MYLAKMAFVIIGLTLAVLMILANYLYTNKKRNILSKSVPFLAIMMFLYVVSGLLFVVFVQGIINKFVILAFILSPMIIGKLVTYKKVVFYGNIQVVLILLSLVYIYALI